MEQAGTARPRARRWGHRLVACAGGTVVMVAAASPAAADEPAVYATDGTYEGLQAAVDALGGPGVVVIPPGRWDLVGIVEVPFDGVTIIGSGTGSTELARPTPTAEQWAAATEEGAPPNPYIYPYIEAEHVSRLRVSGIAFRGWPAAALGISGWATAERGIEVRAVTDFRVDHCLFDQIENACVNAKWASHGVVDHCVMRRVYGPSVANLGYGVGVYGMGEHDGEPLGSANAVFVEDTVLRACRHAVASNAGGRYVLRHSEVTDNVVSHVIDAHGAEYPPRICCAVPAPSSCTKDDSLTCYDYARMPDTPELNEGTEWIEVYRNTISQPGDPHPAVGIRGGGGAVWENEIIGHTPGFRLRRKTPEPTGPVYIWSNTGETTIDAAGNCCGAGPTYETQPPTGYEPYTYPHPLVTDLVAAAGPDVVVMPWRAGEPAQVFVDGSGSSCSEGEISSYGWYASPERLSVCVRDVLELDEGQHALLLQATRDDGLVEHDVAVVTVLPYGPVSSTSTWESRWFAPFDASGTISLTITPSAAPTNAYVGLAGRHGVGAHEDLAMQIRLFDDGMFDVRDGTAGYGRAADVSYAAGQAHRVEVSFDLDAQRYDVSVDGTVVAQGFEFRNPDEIIGQLVVWSSDGLPTISIDEVSFSGPQLGRAPSCLLRPEHQAGPEAAGGAPPGVTSPAGEPEAASECGCHAPGRRSLDGRPLLLLVGVLWAGLGRKRWRSVIATPAPTPRS